MEVSLVKNSIRPTGAGSLTLPLVRGPVVSPQALALFRLIERLSRRTGYACVNLLETLADMLGKSVRAVRYALAELTQRGWIMRQQTRKGGSSKLFFWPLVRVPSRSRGLFSPPKVAGCSAVYHPTKLQVTPSAPYKKTPVGKEDDNTNPTTGTTVSKSTPAPAVVVDMPAVVTLLKTCVSESEAADLAREVGKQQLSEEQVRRVIAAYKGQVDKIRNHGAWLREAIRRGFAPSAGPSTHTSDNYERPVRVIAAPPDYRKLCETSREKTPETVNTSQPQQSGPVGIDRLRAVIEAKKRQSGREEA